MTGYTPAERRIMVVEDDDKIAAILVDFLHASGYTTTRCSDGTEVAPAVRADPPAAIILDLMLPGLDGIEVCKQVRSFSSVPIMMVTARIDEIDRLLGLEIGADDYVCKPFYAREVMARIKALLRRADGNNGRNVRRGDGRVEVAEDGFVIVDASRRIRLNGRELPLTPLEFQLLKLLLSSPERVYSRDQLLDTLHDDFRDVSDRAIDSHIKNLRKKIDGVAPGMQCIGTVYGVGYRYEEP